MKTVLITGSTKGIGYSTAIKFLEKGYLVFFNGHKTEHFDHNSEQTIQNISSNYEFYRFDVSNKNEVENAVKKIINKYHKIDVLVNNSGIVRDKSFLKMNEEMWQSVIDVNLKGSYNVCKSVLPHMYKDGFGRIINISSVVGLSGNFGQTNYAASKAGLIGLTKSLAIEVAKKNITVNAIAPGFINTDMTKSLSANNLKTILDRIPMGRMGEPDDIANLVLFLANDDTKYITGETISINGGYYLN